MKTIVVDGLSVEMADKDAQIVQKTIAALEKQVKDATEETAEEKKKRLEAEAKAAKDATEVATRDATIATLQQQVKDATPTPALLDGMVRDRATVVAAAKAVLPAVVIDGRTDADIRRQVVDARMGDRAKGWTDEQVAASFGTLTVDVKATGSNVNDLARSLSAPNTPDARQAAYDEYNKYLESAHRNTKAA